MRRLLKVGIVIVLAALLAFSCSPLGFESGEDSFTFILSLDTNGMRTISPKVDDYKLLNNFDTFSLKIDQGQNNIFTKDTIEIDKESGVISETITLSPGQVYTATAGAKIGGILAAQGVAEFVATSNEGSVAVRLKPIPVNLEGNAGTENAYFQYTITIPASYTASVSLLGPKAVGASAELLTDQLNATIYASLNELWADARIAGEGSYIYNMPPQLFKEGIYDFIVTVRDGTHEKRIVDETAYLYSGLTTKAEGAKFSFTEESINFTNDVLLSGTVNIINTAEQDIGDIYIAVYKGLSGLSNSLTFNTITPENDENLLTFCKLNAVGNAQLISKTWGVKTDAISLNDTLYLKAFSTKTAGCDASVVDRYFESDKKAAENLQTVTYSGGPLSKIVITDKLICPPVLLSASVYNTEPNVIVLVFDDATTLLNTSATDKWVINDGNGDLLATVTGMENDARKQTASNNWRLLLDKNISASQNATIDYTATAKGVINGYNIPMPSLTDFEVRNGADELPQVINLSIMPSSAEARIGDAITITFDKAVKMPAANPANIGFGIVTTESSSNTGLGEVWSKNVYTKDTEHAVPTLFTTLDYPVVADGGDDDSKAANGSISSRIWKLKLATTPVSKNTNLDSYLNNQFIAIGDSISLSYAPQNDNAIVDAYGLSPKSWAEKYVNNAIVAGDWVEPALTRAYVTNDYPSIVNLVFSEAVKIEVASSAAAGFTLNNTKIFGTGAPVADNPINGGYATLWKLSLSAALVHSDSISISYSSNADTGIGKQVFDAAGNYLSAVGGTLIENGIASPPVVLSAIISNDNPNTKDIDERKEIVLTFDRAVTIPRVNDFRINFSTDRTEKPTQILSVADVGGSVKSDGLRYGNVWKLSLNKATLYEDSQNAKTIKLSYTDPGAPVPPATDCRVRAEPSIPVNYMWTTSPAITVTNNVGQIVKLTLDYANGSEGKGLLIPAAGMAKDYVVNTNATAQAVPYAGYSFIGWYGTAEADKAAISQNSAYTAPISGNKTLYAKFDSAEKLSAPGTPALSNTGVASWIPVNNLEAEYSYVDGYNIDIYKGSTKVTASPVFVSGASSNSLNIRVQLLNAAKGSYGNGEYKFSISAVSSDSTVYNNSDVVTSGTQTVTQLVINPTMLVWDVDLIGASGVISNNTANIYTANWTDAVTTGAGSQLTYTVKLYNTASTEAIAGGSVGGLVVTTKIMHDPKGENANGAPFINNMGTNGTYYYTVQAIAGNTLFYDSAVAQSVLHSVGINTVASGFLQSDFPGDVPFTVTRNNDEEVAESPPHLLSQMNGDTITFAISDTSATNISWYVGSTPASTPSGSSWTFDSSLYPRGSYTVSVRATIDGIEYSANTTVRVGL